VRNGAVPAEFIGRDTLIVEALGEDRRVVYFFMDVRTGALSPMTNPHLDPYSTISAIAWNDERRRLVASVRGSSRRATLALTDLDGTFFRALTEEGPYRDVYPRFCYRTHFLGNTTSLSQRVN